MRTKKTFKTRSSRYKISVRREFFSSSKKSVLLNKHYI